jgi:hypothetical protein
MIRAALLAGVSSVSSPAPPDAIDVVRCELEVVVREDDLAVATTIHATGAPQKQWRLELVPEMKVVAAASDGATVPFSASGSTLTLDLGAVATKGGEFAVTVRCEGSPCERFSQSHGGFVRSVVGPEATYIRSQVAWYPRAPNDPALYDITVDAPAGHQVRSAGEFEPPVAKGGRATWKFHSRTAIERAGLASGTWKVISSASFDALVRPEHEKAAEGLLALARKALEFHAKELGALSRPRFALVEMPKEFGPSSGYSEQGYFLIGPQPFEDGAGAAWVEGFLAHEAAHQWWGMDGRFRDFASEGLAEFSMLRFLRSAEGEEAARRVRRKAIESVVASAAAGKEIALASIEGWGGGLDPALYEVHAYAKLSMVLAMVERAVGPEAMSKLLARFFLDARARPVGWKELRAALCAAGNSARTVVEQWEAPGIPRLSEEHQAKKAGAKWKVSGKVVQSGTAKPFTLSVPIEVQCGNGRFVVEVKLAGAEAAFTIETPAEPDAVVVDPDWEWLVARDLGGSDPKPILEAAMKVANDTREARPEVLTRAIADLRGLLAKSALSGGEEGAAHTGVGRCLFRSGKLDEAEKELNEALRLGAGGPFHRGWVHLRLGCIADLKKDRKSALDHYRAVVDSSGSSKSAVEKAKTLLERPYRGYATDG